MNKKTISFKADDFTITLHKGEEEPKEIEQKRMARYVTCLCNLAMKLMIKHFEEYCPELQTEVCNILKKAESKILNVEILKPRVFKFKLSAFSLKY